MKVTWPVVLTPATLARPSTGKTQPMSAPGSHPPRTVDTGQARAQGKLRNMNSSIAASRFRREAALLGPAQARDRWVRRRVGIAWGLLVLNCPDLLRIHTAYPVVGGQGHRAGSPAAWRYCWR